MFNASQFAAMKQHGRALAAAVLTPARPSPALSRKTRRPTTTPAIRPAGGQRDQAVQRGQGQRRPPPQGPLRAAQGRRRARAADVLGSGAASVREASNYFYDELVRILAGGDASALGPAPASALSRNFLERARRALHRKCRVAMIRGLRRRDTRRLGPAFGAALSCLGLLLVGARDGAPPHLLPGPGSRRNRRPRPIVLCRGRSRTRRSPARRASQASSRSPSGTRDVRLRPRPPRSRAPARRWQSRRCHPASSTSRCCAGANLRPRRAGARSGTNQHGGLLRRGERAAAGRFASGDSADLPRAPRGR